tara:strand:+ start:311 stop:751 length:441 start_codon:yes stop_codon:yes gene_type:complete
MAKGDYTDSATRELYKALVVKPTEALSTITVADSEKRTRAELLDMVEELFQTVFTHTSSLTPDLTKLRAILHILIKSMSNTSDDSSGISTSQANAIVANTAKVSQGLSTANTSMSFTVTSSRGAYTLNVLVNCDDGRTRSTSLSLS